MSLIRAQADKEEPAPQFQEVFGLIRSNLAGMSEAELNRAATRGLLAQLVRRLFWSRTVFPPSPRRGL